MKNEIFKEGNLPVNDLEKIGLASKGKIFLDADDLQAILSGRRTDMIKIHNLSADGINIKELDAKVSVKKDVNGNLELILHPIHKEAAYPDFLTDVEAEKLQNGETVSITKAIKDDDGKHKDIIVEFDPETNEFIITDSRKILIPDMVNNEYLSETQKELFRRGKEVELSDGTKFKYTGSDRSGFRANKVALIASILIDGGISYLLYQGIMSLTGKRQQGDEANAFSAGYYKAFEDMSNQIESKQKKGTSQEFTNDPQQEQSIQRGRSGVSR